MFQLRILARPATIPRARVAETRQKGISYHLWLKLFFKQSALNRPSNIHVRVLGNPNQHYPILFRDYLRANPKAAQSIAHIKKQISIRHADDIDAYYDIKDPVYDLIWYAAQEWEKQNQTLT